MLQLIRDFKDGEIKKCYLPNKDEEVMPGVRWGAADEFFTPAFWAVQMWLSDIGNSQDFGDYRLGETLEEEICACLLGGHGIPAEVGLAAYRRVLDSGILNRDHKIKQETILSLLEEPLMVYGRSVRYRFAKQKSRYLSESLNMLRQSMLPDDEIEFRNWLAKNLLGVGLKTASWVTRNWLKSDSVAILDIHIYRAGLVIGIYSTEDDINKNYMSMEERFIAFANGIDVPPSKLDNLIWNTAKDTGGILLERAKDLAGESKIDRGLVVSLV